MTPDRASGPARTPFFYGWAVVAAAMVVQAATLPGQTAGVSVFLDGIIADLDTSRSVVSSLYTAATLTGSLVLAWVGRMLDRHGARRGLTVIGLGFAGACVAMGSVSSIALLGIGFLGLRMLGQGSLGLVGPFAVNQWFVRNRGRAVGIMSVGFSLAIAAVAPGFTVLEDRFGWQMSYRLLGVGVVVVVALTLLVMRDRPETYGLLPDGDAPVPSATPGAHGMVQTSPIDEPSVRPEVARRSGVFWLFALGVTTTSTLGTGIQFHHFSIMAENGVGRTQAATVFVAIGLSAAVATVITGPIVDRVAHRYALAVSMVLLAGSLIAAPAVADQTSLIAYGVALGVGQGIIATVSGSVYAHLFGRAHLGEIKGTATIINIGGSALGPLPFALGLDLIGSYAPILRASAVIPLVVAVIAALTRNGHPTTDAHR